MGRRRLISVLVMATLVGPALAQAEDWIELPTTTSWYRFEFDRDSIVRDGKVMRFWDRTVFLRPVLTDAASGRTVAEKRVRRIVRCDERVEGVLEGRVIGIDGRILESASFPEWRVDPGPVVPGSLASRLIDAVCAAAAPAGTPRH